MKRKKDLCTFHKHRVNSLIIEKTNCALKSEVHKKQQSIT